MCQSGSCPEIATRAMKWMVVSQRPLKPDELIAAAELDPALSTTLGLELDIDQLIHICGGLLLQDNQLGVIRFSHLSVQEYLETESMNKYWDIIDAQHLVMEACLWILQCQFPPESISLDLYSYTACHWFRHCRFYQDLAVEAIAAANSKPSKHILDVPLLKSFLVSFDQLTASYEQWKNWVSEYYGKDEDNTDYLLLIYPPDYPAFAAAVGGLGEMVSWLWLEKGIDMNVRDSMGTPLLHYATASGSAKLVQQMIAMGADTNAISDRDGTSLGCAAWRGNVELVSLLLDLGADIHAVGGEYGTALGCACASWHSNLELVSLLLDRGADIDLVGGDYGTALGCAAWGGNVEFVSLLLDRGADIHAVGGKYGTALGCAATEGDMELVSLLLDRDADIHVVSGEYGTALGCAVWSGNVELVSLLLDRGADIHAVSGDYGTPLNYACVLWNSNVELVSLFLDRGADINAVGGGYGTALGCAAWNGSVEVVLLLLNRGADIHIIGGDYGTALGCAAANGNVEVVSLLLDRGADINVVGGYYGTALGCTCVLLRELRLVTAAPAIEIATLLLQRGVDVNIRFGGQYGTALGVSAFMGYIEVARLLMKHGANPDLTNDDGLNARALAESAGNLDIIQFLDSWDPETEQISNISSSRE